MPLCVPSHRIERQAETNNSPLDARLSGMIAIGRTPIRRRSTIRVADQQDTIVNGVDRDLSPTRALKRLHFCELETHSRD
jgi:hypothetical protein